MCWQLRTAAGTIDALRLMNEGSGRAQLSFEEKCREAFSQIENLTGASDLSEVLQVVTSKHELVEQLQRRVAAVQERIEVLNGEKGVEENHLTEAMYGMEDDAELRKQTDEQRVRAEAANASLKEVSGRTNETVRLLTDSRLAWENLAKLLELGGSSNRLNTAQSGSGASAPPTTAGGGAGDFGGDAADAGLAMLPLALAELPRLVEDVEARALKVLALTARAEDRAHQKRAALEEEVARAGGGAGGAILGMLRASGPADGGASPPPAAPPAPTATPPPKKKPPAGRAAPAAAVAASDPNIRIMPPEMLDAMLARDDDADGARNAKGAGAPKGGAKGGDGGGREVAFGKAPADGDDDEILSRDDLKAVSLRLARKAARRSMAGGGRGSKDAA